MRKISEYFNKDPDSFTSEKMAKISKAGNGLLTWVKAMIQYHEVAKGVEPKRKLVAELQQKQEQAERSLARTRVCRLRVAYIRLSRQRQLQGHRLPRWSSRQNR